MRASALFARYGAAGGLNVALTCLLLGYCERPDAGLRRGTLGAALPLLLSIALLVPFIFGAGALTGYRHSQAQAAAERETAILAAHKRYDAQLVDGQVRVADLETTLREQRSFYSRLNQRTARDKQTLFVARPAAAASDATAGQADPVVATGQGAPAGPVVLQIELSHAAVRMWDSALLGADVASGACRADGAAIGACAAGSGITFERAWANHAFNAELCAEDRARYRGLISYVETLHQRFKGP